MSTTMAPTTPTAPQTFLDFAKMLEVSQHKQAIKEMKDKGLTGLEGVKRMGALATEFAQIYNNYVQRADQYPALATTMEGDDRVLLLLRTQETVIRGAVAHQSLMESKTMPPLPPVSETQAEKVAEAPEVEEESETQETQQPPETQGSQEESESQSTAEDKASQSEES